MSLLFAIDTPFFDANGAPLAFGTVYFGQPNQDAVSNPKVPYTDDTYGTPLSATQVLTIGGKFAQEVWLDGDYSIIIKDADDVQVAEYLLVPEPEGGGGSGIVESVVAGGGISVDSTDPANPVISTSGGGGDVSGPGSSTDNAIARFNGTDGKTIRNSAVLIDDSANITGATSISLLAGTNRYYLSGRTVVGFPVPYFTPQDNNSNIAFDIFPKGTPGDFTANTGVAWFDLCSTDIEADGTNYECLRHGIFSGGDAHLSHASGGTGAVRNLRLQINGGNVGIGANVTPPYLLTIDGSTLPCLAVRDSGTDRFFFAQATASGNWFTNASDGDHCIRGMGGALLMGTNAATPGYTFGMTSAGAIYNPTHGTTASAANMFINSTSGLISRSTSARRFKTDIAPLLGSSIVYGLEPVTYRSLCENDDPDAVHLGLIAENVAEVVPALASYGEAGEPNGVQYERLSVLLLAEMKHLNERIKKLEGERCGYFYGLYLRFLRMLGLTN